MNQPANCPGGSPYSTPVAGAFGRDLPFLVNVLNVGKSQVDENLFNGNEASIRLDYNLSSNDRLFGQFNWSRLPISLPVAIRRNFVVSTPLRLPPPPISSSATFIPSLPRC